MDIQALNEQKKMNKIVNLHPTLLSIFVKIKKQGIFVFQSTGSA